MQSHSDSPGANWHDVAALADLTPSVPHRTDVEGKPVILIRQENGQVRALSGQCPHKGAPLEKGVVCGNRLVCPWHKAIFSTEDGKLLEPLSLDPLTTWPAEIRNGRIWLSHAAPPRPAATEHQSRESVLIIGAGAAGTATAVSLREFGFTGTITIVDGETTTPYDRTALTKTVLAGKTRGNTPPALRPDNFWQDHNITRLAEKVTTLDAASHTVTLADGQTLTAGHIVIATGAVPHTLDVPGAKLRGVFTLRQAADAQRLLAACPANGRVTIIGGSFIGMEAAASLRTRGMQVTVVAPDDVPFAKVFGQEIGASLLRLHQEKGVIYHGGWHVTAIEGDDHVRRVSLDDGTQLESDLVLAGVGVRPATGFAASLTAEDGGIDVDDSMRAGPGLYVAGDCARITHGGRRIRIEHWRSAEVQGRQVARTITGRTEPSKFLPWFWTQQFDCKIEYAGYHESFDRVAIDGNLQTFNFSARLMQNGRCVGPVTAGRPDVTGSAVLAGTL